MKRIKPPKPAPLDPSLLPAPPAPIAPASDREILLREMREDERGRFDKLLDDSHYLGSTRSAGDRLFLVAERADGPVALFVTGSCCYVIRDRDDWIGWHPRQRAARQKLVVQNRRFALLLPREREPNLASRLLGLFARALPDMWETRFGYRPLMLESFTDPERFEGTCYRAAGWTDVGQSKGFSRARGDLYLRRDSTPKILWMKPLHPRARELLCAPDVHERQETGARSSAHGVLPLAESRWPSLLEALAAARPEGRRAGKYPVRAVLAIVVMALLCGENTVAGFNRFARTLKPDQRAKLGLPRVKGAKAYSIPGYDVYRDILGAVDPAVLAGAINGWLASNAEGLPRALALDGKMIRDLAGTLTLANHETGEPVATAPLKVKEGAGEDAELRAAQRLLEDGPALDGAIVTADALHAQDETARIITGKGGDYLLQAKGNRRSVRDALAAKTREARELLKKRRSNAAASRPGR